MTRVHTALLIGGGIAGPAAAFWLARAGFHTTIVERAPAPRPGGQTVDLRGAGRTVIERMGLLDECRALAVPERGFAFVDARGRISARVPADAFGGEGIVAELEILRGDLGRVLYDATVGATEYLFDDTITSLEQDHDGVAVTFEKAPPRRVALVLGADGLHSAVRRLAFGPDERCVTDLGLLSGGFTATSVPAGVGDEDWLLMYNASGGLVATVRPGRLAGELKVVLGTRSDIGDRGPGDRVGREALLRRRFAGAGWIIPQLLDAMPRATDFYFDSTGQVRLDHWTSGRVALLGDAGYCATPLSGLGTSLALVGAYVLAGELAAARGDHRTAFAAYESRLRPYVREAQKLPGGGVRAYAPTSGAMIRMRVLSMGLMTRWPLRPLIAGQFQKAGAIELPDYEGVAMAI